MFPVASEEIQFNQNVSVKHYDKSVQEGNMVAQDGSFFCFHPIKV